MTAPNHTGNPLAPALEHVLEHTRDLWNDLRGERLFITGGTGFIGCWLLESFTWAADRLALDCSAVVLTRDPEAFARKAPHLAAHPDLSFLRGDVRSFHFPGGAYSHVIHAATEASEKLNAEDPVRMFDTIVTGTRRTLDFAARAGTRRFLLTSSGAVYGKQPPELSHVSEDYVGAPNVCRVASAYSEGKRAAEWLSTAYQAGHNIGAKIARCFAFVGPYLPLDAHFAIGNFIRDQLAGGPIRVTGDGTPFRSYLDAADLAIWLWTILLRGEAGRPYNVGSERALSIREVAAAVAGALQPKVEVQIAHEPVEGQPAARYVPSTTRARSELGLAQWIPLEQAIQRTARWAARQDRTATEA